MDIDAFLEVIEKRRSCRDYLEKDVPDSMIDKCLEAARLAPSACNKQPWRFIIVKDPALREKICSNGLLPGIPMPWAVNAPVIAVLCAEKTTFTHSIAPMMSGVKYHLIDIGIAGEHFVLAAEAQGLGTCWIGWFKSKYVRKLLSIPRSVEILSLITLGFPASHRDPSSRLEINEISSLNTWGNTKIEK